MSDDEVEIIFASVTPSCTGKTLSNNSCHSNSTTISQIPSVSEEKLPKITTKKTIEKSKLQNIGNSDTRLKRNKSVLNLKSVKHANGMNHRVTCGKEADSSGHSVPPLLAAKTPTKGNGLTNELDAKIESSGSLSSPEQIIKLSRQLSKRPNTFSINGSPASSRKNKEIYSNEKVTPRSVCDTSPLTFMRNKFVGKQPINARGVKRKLNFSYNSPRLHSPPKSSISSSANGLNETESCTNSTQELAEYAEGYILRQLDLHVRIVLKHDYTNTLITEEETNLLHLFFNMNSDSKELYARMHHRKYKWNRLSDIRYKSATEENVHLLEKNGFLVTDMQNVGIESILDLLKFSEMKQLCKSLGIKCSVQNKKNVSEEIIRYSQQQKTIGRKLEVVSSKELLLNKIKNILGTCFILSPEPRGLFRRIHLLFNLKFNRNEQTRFGSQDLFDIQFMGTEKALYPKYVIDETANIFSSREELLRFQIAEDLKLEFCQAVVAKDWNRAETILCTVRSNFLTEFDFISYFDESTPSTPSRQLPLALRKFTPGSVYAFILTEGVDILKRLKKTEQAINDLLILLDQTKFLPYMRGRWYEKLLIIYRTTGKLEKVAETICKGISDPHVDDQGFYTMSCRAREILKKKKSKGSLLEAKSLLRDIQLFPSLESVEPTEIKACALDGKSGYRRVFVQDDETGDGKIYSSVEELVINHYCPRVFQHGIHSENSLVSSLFGILFWDVIYEHYVPCAFISPFQTKPLDLSSGEFYKNRKAIIEAKFVKMINWTAVDVAAWVKDIYDNHNGTSSVVHWKWFRSAEHVVGIINSIGMEVVLKMCERYAKMYRGSRSGFPDLFLWTPGQKNQYKFVEVKSPNDRLGTNQKLWLDFLLKSNANVEVCLVQAGGSKAMKNTATEERERNDDDEDNM